MKSEGELEYIKVIMYVEWRLSIWAKWQSKYNFKTERLDVACDVAMSRLFLVKTPLIDG